MTKDLASKMDNTLNIVINSNDTILTDLRSEQIQSLVTSIHIFPLLYFFRVSWYYQVLTLNNNSIDLYLISKSER